MIDQPILEADLGRGHKLLLSEDRLEVDRAGIQRSIDLPSIQEVRFIDRPALESFLFAVPGLCAAMLGWGHLWAMVGIGWAAVAIAAGLTQRRFVLVLVGGQGLEHRIDFGVGSARSTVGQRARSIWESLSQELAGLGVKVPG